MNILKYFFKFLPILFLFILFDGCTEYPTSLQRNEVITEDSPAAIAEELDGSVPDKIYYQTTMRMGHDASSCNGCVLINGQLTHIDCRGAGDKCAVMSAICVSVLPGQISFSSSNYWGHSFVVSSVPDSILSSFSNVYDDFSAEDGIDFPAQSFWITGSCVNSEYRWMNIPSQFIKRDTEDHLFYYDGVTFTKQPLYYE